MSGRPRGRGVARGRGRGVPPATGNDAARRPGSAAPGNQPPSSAGRPQQGPGETGGSGAGRATSRGGAQPRPGAAAAAVDAAASQLAHMSIGSSDAPTARQGRERHVMSYQTQPQTRPATCVDKKGSHGVPVNLYANYFHVESSPDWALYQYHISFSPEIESRKLRSGLVAERARALCQAFLYDGGSILFTITRLPDEITEVFGETRHDNTRVRIIFTRTAELHKGHPQCLQIYNVMLRRILSQDLGLKEVMRSHYDPQMRKTLPRHRLEVWPGYTTAVAQYDGGVMMNVDSSSKVLRTDSALDIMYDLYGRMQGQRFKDECLRQLVGAIVMTRYNDKTYRIDDIEWDCRPNMTFKRRDEEITYIEYYKQMYNITVNDNEQPMLISRPKRVDQREGAPSVLYLLPELCAMTGITDEQRANYGLMQDMAVYTKLDPTKKGKQIMDLRRRIEGTEEAKQRMASWSMRYSDELVKLQGRQLPPETIIMGPDGRSNVARETSAGRDADWGRDVTRGKQLQTVPLNNWLLIWAPATSQNVLDNFLQQLRRLCGPMNIGLSPPVRVALNNNSTSAFLEAIRSHVNPQLQMVVCILPSNKKDLYDAIKKQCCVETPVPSQCITTRVISKTNIMSIVSKIAIQLNCKLGGEAWSMQIPLKKCMVIGIDTYHDSAKKGRSVGGFVASLNGSFTRYYSQTCFQSNMQELIDGLKICMTAALKKWHSVNQCLPDKIMVYRDGVGDGQLSAVHEHEVSQLQAAISAVGQNYNPKLTVIIVKKRINSRFMAPAGSNLVNPGPGTVIDSTVTRPEWYDFFIISQSVRQGTVTPTHYNVIFDTSPLTPDQMQRITYKLCHLYYNWPGTIRVPAPCQYAHKLAFLTGQSIHRDPDLHLADKLFYL